MDSESVSSLFLYSSVTTLSVTDYFLIAFLVLLISISSFLSCAEVAFFSLDNNDINSLKKSLSSSKGHLLESLANSERLLASILISYNVLNVAIVTLLIYLFRNTLTIEGSTYAIMLLYVSIAVLLVLIIEVLPKLYALHKPFKVAQRNIKRIMLVDTIVSPFSSYLIQFTNIFSLVSVQRNQEISMDDLSKALELTSIEEPYEQEDKDMLEGIIRFHEKDVSDILISRADMFALSFNISFDELIESIKKEGFSRIPIYEDNPDQIRGILYVKDLLSHIGKPSNFKWKTLIRSAYFVPANKRIDELLEEFRANKNHMAIVVDEYGGTIGIVTLEDILEEIVGDISDEYDEEVESYTIEPDGSYIFDGKTPLVDFLRVVHIPERDFHEMLENVDTLAGLILELHGTFPKQKDSFKYLNYIFVAEEMNKRRIVRVRYIPPKNTEK